MRVFRFVFSKLFICLFTVVALCAATVFFCLYLHSLLPIGVAICLAYALSVAATLFLLHLPYQTHTKLAFIALIIFLPVIGATLCFICLARTAPTAYGKPIPQTSYSNYQYFNDGGLLLQKLIELVASAQNFVYLEFYIISKGKVWAELYDKLLNALNNGVQVKLIYDGLGSALKAPKKDFKRLIAAGAKIKIFNKPTPFPLSKLNVRDHRKLAVIDGEVALLGGVNIADEYAHQTRPYGFWKDGGAIFYGSAALTFKEVFLSLFEGRAPKFNDSAKDQNKLIAVADSPDHGGVFENEVTAKIYTAKRQVFIFTPYLCLNEKLFDALTFAAFNGVDVAIIIPGIPDKRLPYAITKIYANELLNLGVNVYKYSHGFMHFKGAVFDDVAYIGSYNFDMRSTRLNYEVGAFVNRELATEIKKDFIACREVSVQLSPSRRGGVKKLYDGALRLLAPLI